MTKTMRITDFLVVVLSCSLFGCAKNLPELPNIYSKTPDAADTPAPAEVATVASPISVVNPVLASEVSYAKSIVDNGNDSELEFIANDLVKALSFISGMEPELMSVKAPATGSAFDTLVKKSMQQQGYRFDGRDFQSGGRQLTTSFAESNNELQLRELTAIIAIDTALIRRTYLIQKDGVEPKSLYVIRGVQPELVDSNELVRPF